MIGRLAPEEERPEAEQAEEPFLTEGPASEAEPFTSDLPEPEVVLDEPAELPPSEAEAAEEAPPAEAEVPAYEAEPAAEAVLEPEPEPPAVLAPALPLAAPAPRPAPGRRRRRPAARQAQLPLQLEPTAPANAGVRSATETREDLIQRLLDPHLSLQETAKLLNVCPTTVRRYTNRGLLAHYRTPGNQRRFRLSDVLAFMERQGIPAHGLERKRPALLAEDEDEAL